MRRVSWRGAALAAMSQAGTGELLAAVLPGARSPLSGVGQTLIDFLPGPSADMVVATAETKDKTMLRLGLGALALGSGALAADLEARGHGLGQALLLGQGLVAGAAAASRPENSRVFSLLAGLGSGAAGAGGIRALTGRADRRRERVLLRAAAASLGAAAALRARERAAAERRRQELFMPAPAQPAPPLPPSAELDIPAITPLFTPNDDFYVTDTVLTAPRVDLDRWRLRVRGQVERELELSLDELLAMDLVELDATLVCVHNPVGGDRVGSARWLGVPLPDLLERAGVRAGADQVLTHSVTGFTAGLPLAMAGQRPAPLIALGMNGEPLMVHNGFPARLLTPGIWGADANTKWLGTIELTSWDRASDYWDARGWPRVPGVVKPGSRIDVPADRSTLVSGSVVVAGVAWSPRDGVSAVEVSIDGGRWQPADLSPELAPTLWRQWRLNWRAEPGMHELRVRTLGNDAVQDEEPAPPYPRGSSGFHTVRVRVQESGVLPAAPREWLAQTGADLAGRGRLAAMAPPAWLREGFPGAPRFDESLPAARRGPRQLLPSRP